jgi:hypothetical protein
LAAAVRAIKRWNYSSKSKITMRAPLLLAGFLLIFSGLHAQAPGKPDLDSLKLEERQLGILAYQMINAGEAEERLAACNDFIPRLISALRIRGSFYFPFDSLKEISELYPKDSSFRIFTWQMDWTRGNEVYFGAIQMRTAEGDLKLFPLLDYSTITTHFEDTITSNLRWMGALYYNLVETSYKGTFYYTLFGFNGNGILSKRKILEVLSFQNGKPVFGAPLFSFVDGAEENRFTLEYKPDGNARLNYDPAAHMIIYDHLISLNGEPQKKFTLVPDGTYEGFRWQSGKWRHVSEAFGPAQKLSVPQPVNFPKNGADSQHN